MSSQVILNCQNLTKSYPNKSLFEELTFGLFKGDHVGIIGENGSGKSTLMRILYGLEQADSGEVVKKKYLKLGFIQQQDDFDSESSLVQAMQLYFESNIAANEDYSVLIDQTLSKGGFYDLYDSFISEQDYLDFNLVKVKQLSGGWRKRLSIVCGLACEPELLLIDEPTNHLDIKSILWLEAELKKAKFAWLLVSHDRYFLESCVSKIYELNPMYENGILANIGAYESFLLKRNEYLLGLQAQAQTLGNKLRKEEEWLSRQPKARTTKSRSRIDRAGLLKESLYELNNRLKTRELNIDFTSANRKSKKLIETKDISLKYGDTVIFENYNLNITSNMCLALLGFNGSGKSSLLKVLLKELQPNSGSVLWANDLKCVYYEQNRAELDLTLTLEQALCPSGGDSVIYQGSSIHVAAWAKRFKFNLNQLNLPLKELSGGEQARVVIARLILKDADILCLDEPTNDLDISTLEILEEALSSFRGAVIIISHDRFLLKKICTSFFAVGGTSTGTYFASYEQWQQTLEGKKEDKKAEKTKNKLNDKSKSVVSTKKPKKLSYKEQRELDSMEQNVQDAELKLEQIQSKLDNPDNSSHSSKLNELVIELQQAQELVDALYLRWGELESKSS